MKGQMAFDYETDGDVLDKPTLAIDPGLTIGWAFRDQHGYVVGQCRNDHIWQLLDEFALIHKASTVVYERFDYRTGQVHADLTPVEVIGVIKEWYRQNLLKFSGRLVAQRPVDAKFYFTDERLKRMGRYTPGNPHANDAMRHLLLSERTFV